jgi:hypothetical protein
VDGTDVSYPGADGGAVGGSSRRERYSVPGTTPWGRRNKVSFQLARFPKLDLKKLKNRDNLKKMVAVEGIEPPTLRI